MSSIVYEYIDALTSTDYKQIREMVSTGIDIVVRKVAKPSQRQLKDTEVSKVSDKKVLKIRVAKPKKVSTKKAAKKIYSSKVVLQVRQCISESEVPEPLKKVLKIRGISKRVKSNIDEDMECIKDHLVAEKVSDNDGYQYRCDSMVERRILNKMTQRMKSVYAQLKWSKFTPNKSKTTNKRYLSPKSADLIIPLIGRIIRDGKGKTYDERFYSMGISIIKKGEKHLIIQYTN